MKEILRQTQCGGQEFDTCDLYHIVRSMYMNLLHCDEHVELEKFGLKKD